MVAAWKRARQGASGVRFSGFIVPRLFRLLQGQAGKSAFDRDIQQEWGSGQERIGIGILNAAGGLELKCAAVIGAVLRQRDRPSLINGGVRPLGLAAPVDDQCIQAVFFRTSAYRLFSSAPMPMGYVPAAGGVVPKKTISTVTLASGSSKTS